jgi:hypothetical protein
MSVGAEALAFAPTAHGEAVAPLARVEKLALGAQLTLAMLSGALVIVALSWEWVFRMRRRWPRLSPAQA